MSTSSSMNGYVGGAAGKAKGSNVPIGHLDYSYVSKCNNAKELEDIILVLRSGTEGYYPDLVEYTENKLKEINPKSPVLRKDNPVQSYKDLDQESQKEVSDDLQDWMAHMNSIDAELKLSGDSSDVVNGDTLPPIRTMKDISQTTTGNAVKTDTLNSKKTVKPRDYAEWDRFDVKKELSEIDKQEMANKARKTEKKNLFESKPTSTKDMNSEERHLRAMKEKEKGNEAFKAQEFEEAIVYYTNSLGFEPMAASYNNRAAAELKLEKYSEAIEDCHRVLEIEQNNIKAYLRRGLAFKALKQYSMAAKDFNSMLTLDADNKRAKQLLAEIEEVERQRQQVPKTSTSVEKNEVKEEAKDETLKNGKSKKNGQRLKIVEIDSSNDVAGGVPSAEPHAKETGKEKVADKETLENAKTKKKGQRLKIVEIENANDAKETTVQPTEEATTGNSHVENRDGKSEMNDSKDRETKDSGDSPAVNHGIDPRPAEQGTGNDNELVKDSKHENEVVNDSSKIGVNKGTDSSSAKNAGIAQVPAGEGTGDNATLNKGSKEDNQAEKNNVAKGAEASITPAKDAGNRAQSTKEGIGTDNTTKDDSKNQVINKGLNTGGSEKPSEALAKDSGINDKNITSVKEQSKIPSADDVKKADYLKETATTPGQSAKTAKSREDKPVELPAKVKSLMEEGNKLYKMGHYPQALDKYSKSVNHLWKDRESYRSAVSSLINNKAACCFKMGDSKECIRQCNMSLELVNNVRALVRRGMAYETLEKYAEAFIDFNHVRLQDGSNKLAQEHCSRAIKHLEMQHGKSWRKKIFEMTTDNGQQTLPNAENSQKIPAPSVPKSVPPSVPKPVPPAPKETEKTSIPQSPHLQPELTPKATPPKTVTESDEKVNHKDEFEKNKQEQYFKLKNSGNSLVKEGKHDQAVNFYTDCIKLCPDEVAVYTNRALCYLQLNKHDLAEADCNQALGIEADNIKALFRRAKARKAMGRYRESSQDLITVLKLDTKNAPAKSELNEVLQLLKKEKDVGKPTAAKRKRIVIKDTGGDENTNQGATDVVKDKSSSASGKKNEDGVIPNEKVPDSGSTEVTKEEKGVDRKQDKMPQGTNSVAKDTSTPPTKKKKSKANKKKTTVDSGSKKITGENTTVPVGPNVADQKSTPVAENTTVPPCETKKEPKEEPQPIIQDPTTNDTAKEQNTTPVKHNVKTGFQFLQTWESVKKGDTQEYLNVLKQVNLAELRKVISNRLDADMIRSIFQALHMELKSKGDIEFVCNFLQKLQYVERFQMVLMFQSQQEKQALAMLFDEVMEECNKQRSTSGEDMVKLRKKYGV